ncbi:MAG: ABC-F family ATP-binding cassette domain-containing protein [bacterium]|nr:ABC-F family ATP-binding cassette domain-containing protein [bacterium]
MNKPAISATDIGKSFGQYEKIPVLKALSFSLQQGEKVGLVGPNGTGKSTLLKILAGVIEADTGKVACGKGLSVGYLEQEPYTETTLSGGERARKALDRILADEHDILLLDEPTNNLDIEILDQLEASIRASSKTYLIVSHDRYFLDKTASRIFELDPHMKSLSIYNGGFSDYLEERSRRIELQWKDYAEKMSKEKKLDASYSMKLSHIRAIEKVRMGIRKLHPKLHDKPDDAMLRDKEAKAGRRAKVMKNRLERFRKESEKIEKPIELPPLRIEFEHPERSGDKVFDVTGLVKRFPGRTIGPIDLSVRYGERISIAGKNGAGKTTLIKMLLGMLASDEGEIVRGTSVKVGYMPQSHDLTDNNTVKDEFLRLADMEETEGRKILARFRLSSDDMDKQVEDLSSGERSRLILALLVAQRANCLVLDEPSNHLDLEALESLEDALSRFTGTVIVVSHDRYFLERVALTRTVVIR